MALSSPLFTAAGPGKALLDRCAAANDGHFFQGMKGRSGLADAVTRIRAALAQLGFTTDDPAGVYGPSTAEAVFKFKGPPRNILGPGQKTPDKIVGIQTIARLDAAIQNQPAPPPLTFGSTSWRFSFFGNKGFTGRGIYTFSVASTQQQDRKDFTIFERATSGSLLAGFRGESHGTFVTPRKAKASDFSQASVVLKLFKSPTQSILDGDLQLQTLLGAGSMNIRLPISIDDETLGTTLTSGNFEMRGETS